MAIIEASEELTLNVLLRLNRAEINRLMRGGTVAKGFEKTGVHIHLTIFHSQDAESKPKRSKIKRKGKPMTAGDMIDGGESEHHK